jgi:hypothetical protein
MSSRSANVTPRENLRDRLPLARRSIARESFACCESAKRRSASCVRLRSELPWRRKRQRSAPKPSVQRWRSLRSKERRIAKRLSRRRLFRPAERKRRWPDAMPRSPVPGANPCPWSVLTRTAVALRSTFLEQASGARGRHRDALRPLLPPICLSVPLPPWIVPQWTVPIPTTDHLAIALVALPVSTLRVASRPGASVRLPRRQVALPLPVIAHLLAVLLRALALALAAVRSRLLLHRRLSRSVPLPLLANMCPVTSVTSSRLKGNEGYHHSEFGVWSWLHFVYF